MPFTPVRLIVDLDTGEIERLPGDVVVQLFFGTTLPLGWSYVHSDFDEMETALEPYACGIGDFGVTGESHYLYIEGTQKYFNDGDLLDLRLPRVGKDWDERLGRWQRFFELSPDKGEWTLLIADSKQRRH